VVTFITPDNSDIKKIQMKKQVDSLFVKHFSVLDDPRKDDQIKHNLLDILVIAICATICGADGWQSVEEYGLAKQDWLSTFLELPHGIPSHDTFGRIFARISPVRFQECFSAWVQDVFTVTDGQVVPIDGKTLRRSHNKSTGKKAIHMVSAWAAKSSLVLAQVKTDEKSNEINAIPKLLSLLDIKGCIVTIDAMGCQKKIAGQIIDQGGDYALAVKGNQETLYHAVQKHFTKASEQSLTSSDYDYHETKEKIMAA
jgi:predicted transposase YbfD/YdcC